jgi:hypothetical protein
MFCHQSKSLSQSLDMMQCNGQETLGFAEFDAHFSQCVFFLSPGLSAKKDLLLSLVAWVTGRLPCLVRIALEQQPLSCQSTFLPTNCNRLD